MLMRPGFYLGLGIDLGCFLVSVNAWYGALTIKFCADCWNRQLVVFRSSSYFLG